MWLVFICIPVVPHEISNPTRRRVATQGHITTPDQSSPPHSAPHLARQPEQHHVAPTPPGHPTHLARALLDSSPHQGGDHFLPTPVLLTIVATCTATIGALTALGRAVYGGSKEVSMAIIDLPPPCAPSQSACSNSLLSMPCNQLQRWGRDLDVPWLTSESGHQSGFNNINLLSHLLRVGIRGHAVGTPGVSRNNHIGRLQVH